MSIRKASVCTAPPTGRGRLRLAAAAAVGLATLLAAGPAPGKARPEESLRFPWTSTGGLVFHLDAASFAGDSTSGRTEFYVRIPGSELVYRDTTEGDSASGWAEVRHRLRIKGARGKLVHDRTGESRIPPREQDAGGFSLGHVLLLGVPLAPGWYEARLDLDDLRSQRVGLAYLGRKAHRQGKAEGTFFVPPLARGDLVVSELEPAWSIRQRAGESPFARGAAEVVPNPSRTYGLYQPTVRAYYEVLRSAGREGPVPVSARVRDPAGTALLVAEPDSLAGHGRTWGQVAFDVSTLAAGAYDLALTVGSGEGAVERRMRFSVAWRQETWRGSPRELEDEMRFLLDDQDKEEAFSSLAPGEQEAYLDRYWVLHDPDPATAANEARERFARRVAHANEHFGIRGVLKGMLSDRGRVYIRFGEPDEVRREVMPTQGLQVDDIAREIAAEQGFASAVALKGRGAGGDMRSFEIWSYDRLLHPEEEEREGTGPRRPLRRLFVFVDEEGYGDYVLRYSNE